MKATLAAQVRMTTQRLIGKLARGLQYAHAMLMQPGWLSSSERRCNVIQNSEAIQTQDSPHVTKKVKATSATQIRMMKQELMGKACMSSAICACSREGRCNVA